MDAQRLETWAGFFRLGLGLLEPEEVEFPYEQAPFVCCMLSGRDTPSKIWWCASIRRDDAGRGSLVGVRVFAVEGAAPSVVDFDVIEELIRQRVTGEGL